jgi:hypothetical protein
MGSYGKPSDSPNHKWEVRYSFPDYRATGIAAVEYTLESENIPEAVKAEIRKRIKRD